jgi:hypothetical protein
MTHKVPKFKVVKTHRGMEFGFVQIGGLQFVTNSAPPTRFELKDAERHAVRLGREFSVVPCGSPTK